jgi:hypothetical protein
MQVDWELLETNTHQDHVIAHVVGATILGYFTADETACLALDIGFIWTIFVDGEMGLVPQTMAIGELDVDVETRAVLRADIDALSGSSGSEPRLITPAAEPLLISDVHLYANGDERRVLVKFENSSLAIKTSLETGLVRFQHQPG